MPPVEASAKPVIAPVQNGEHTVRSLSGQATRCYKQGLLRDENQQGRVKLTIVVGPSGDVESATTHVEGVDELMGHCILEAVMKLQFDPDPNRGQATINTSFNFVKQ